MPSHIAVVGAGLAGLSAAIALTQAGKAVTLIEAGPAAGGRCRSYFDRELGLRIDNGNHLLLSGNHATFGYLNTIGATETLAMPAAPMFPFMDLRDGRRWVLRPNFGKIPWWVLSRARRVPGTRVRDYLALQRLRKTNSDAAVGASMRHDTLYGRLLEPLAVAALNTPADEGLVRLLATVMEETLFQGGRACIPAVPRAGLSESLVDPAIAWLAAHGSMIHMSRRVAALCDNGNGVEFSTTEGPMRADSAVLAVPPWVLSDLLPGQLCPTAFQAILNIHFRIAADCASPGFIGLIGGTAEWVFVKLGHVSVTVSAANRMVDQDAETIARAVWPDVRAALELPDGPLPPWRVVKERRATVAAIEAQERLRPGPRTRLANVVLAGDWTNTGLPGTIEGAIRSGRTAADVLLAA
jgi:squalene-associated FAD-dependent desaturase